MDRILVLGGYGNFGKLICEVLAKRSDIELIVGGRSRQKANDFSESLKANGARCKLSSIASNIRSNQLTQELKETQPLLVINTCGPFQGQDYHVPNACIAIGSHYIDLADDRRFVCDFHTLNEEAIKNNVIAISGVSSVPALSSVVIDHYEKKFDRLEEIDFCIAPGSNVELGEATLKGILSNIGKPFKRWEYGRWIDRFGWMNSTRVDLGEPLGSRWLANVDIPDLELFPLRYPDVKTVRFRAGHELGIAHLSMNLMAQLTRLKLFRYWDHHASTLFKAGQQIKSLGTDCGGMVIQLSGINHQGQQQKTIWRLIAKKGVGLHIPTLPAIILANRILGGELIESGARPCLGMFTLETFNKIAEKWDIYQEVEKKIG